MVKVRLIKKEILSSNKLYGPQAVSFFLTASVCDKNGKALIDNDGRAAIIPHTVTIPLLETGLNQKAIKKGLDDAIKPLVQKTVDWARTRAAADQVLAAWEKG